MQAAHLLQELLEEEEAEPGEKGHRMAASALALYQLRFPLRPKTTKGEANIWFREILTAQLAAEKGWDAGVISAILILNNNHPFRVQDVTLLHVRSERLQINDLQSTIAFTMRVQTLHLLKAWQRDRHTGLSASCCVNLHSQIRRTF